MNLNIDTLAKTVGHVPSPTAEQLAGGRNRLNEAIDALDKGIAGAGHSRRPRRLAFGALAGVAAAAVAAVIVVPLLSAAPASAEEVLLAAADAAGEEVDETVGANYWYVTSEVDYPYTDPFRREIWKGRSSDSVLRTEEFAAEAAKSAGGALDPALVHTETLFGPAAFPFGNEELSWGDLDQLPTDAEALEQALREKVRDHPAGEDNELWEGVTGLLLEGPLSPSLRRAWWQVAANIPDVELLGPMTDSVGREGVAIERNQLDQGWYRVVYILDPGDGTMLETRNLEADGSIEYRFTKLSQTASDSAPPAETPPCEPASESERGC